MHLIYPIGNSYRFSVSIINEDEDARQCLCKFLMRVEQLGAKIICDKDDDIYQYKLSKPICVDFSELKAKHDKALAESNRKYKEEQGENK